MAFFFVLPMACKACLRSYISLLPLILDKSQGDIVLNEKYLKEAIKVISDRAILINLAARRAKELAHGAHPLVNVDRSQRTQYLDIALREIAEEKLSFELIED